MGGGILGLQQKLEEKKKMEREIGRRWCSAWCGGGRPPVAWPEAEPGGARRAGSGSTRAAFGRRGSSVLEQSLKEGERESYGES